MKKIIIFLITTLLLIYYYSQIAIAENEINKYAYSDNEDVYTALVDGINQVYDSDHEGPIRALDPSWEAIIGGDDDTSSPNVTMIARTYGKGRVIASSIYLPNVDLFDNKKMILNITEWLNQDNSKRIAFSSGHREWKNLDNSDHYTSSIEGRGYTLTQINHLITDNLKTIDILIIGTAWNDFTNQEISDVESFVKNGGGLWLVGLGWSWLLYHEGTTMEDYPMAKMGLPYGCSWRNGSISDPTNNVDNWDPVYHTFYPNVKNDAIINTVSLDERNALIELYQYTGGDNWKKNENWLGDFGTECSWYGITCNDTNSHVVRIGLHDNNLTSQLPSSLSNFSNLTFIDFRDNSLSGGLPLEIGSLSELTELNISGNKLTGEIPVELFNAKKLQNLFLRENELSGHIPLEIENLSSLKSLHLFSNKLTGTIPKKLWTLTNLSELCLHNNQLTGEIPSEIENLSKLVTLNLSKNKLSGEIPVELYNISGLINLYLDHNQLTGEIHSSIDSLSNLAILALAHNNFTGNIPKEIGSLLKLQAIWCDNNQLTGSIPHELGNTNLLEIVLSHNNLTGSIPKELSKLVHLRSLCLDNNNLTGEIPKELGKLTNLNWYLRLDNNQLIGSIPIELGNLINLEYHLYLNNNKLTGSIPKEIGQLTKVYELFLHNNQLTGEIPTEIGNMSNLKKLIINNNKLSGSIPAELGNLSELNFLYLNNNLLKGDIPKNIGKLDSLFNNQLNLCSNYLYSNDNTLTIFLNSKHAGGDWQSCQLTPVTEREALIEIYQSTNGNSWNNKTNWLGEIGTECTWYGVLCDELNHIKGIYLNDNNLNGSIPKEIFQLEYLQSISLDNNNLTNNIISFMNQHISDVINKHSRIDIKDAIIALKICAGFNEEE